MDDNNLVTHGLHWLTLGQDGWQCAHPDCDWWHTTIMVGQADAQRVFNADHAKLSEAPTSVQP